MCRAAAPEMMTFYQSRKAPALAGSEDVDQFIPAEDIDHDFIAGIGSLLALDTDFAHKSGGRHVRFLEVAGHRLVHPFRLYEFD